MSIFVYTCGRCDESTVGEPFRVVSETSGERLLDMIVCYGCYVEASQLGLETKAILLGEFVLN